MVSCELKGKRVPAPFRVTASAADYGAAKNGRASV
jgi:hypothetical protein